MKKKKTDHLLVVLLSIRDFDTLIFRWNCQRRKLFKANVHLVRFSIDFLLYRLIKNADKIELGVSANSFTIYYLIFLHNKFFLRRL